MHFLRSYWEFLRASYWFLPSIMTLASMIVALAVVRLDEAIGNRQLSELGWIYTGGANGARQLLATVAGSMITVAGTVFSVTVVALSLASNQFGPRLLQNFMRDRGNQVVLGTFIATFAYCLLVLRTVRGTEDGDFVPNVAVTLGVVLALASVGVLIYFIHHASIQMQAPLIIANVGRELCQRIRDQFPDELTNTDRDLANHRQSVDQNQFFDRPAATIAAADSGYIQDIDEQQLRRLATEHDLVVRIVHRPGQFVIAGAALVEVAPQLPKDELTGQLRRAFLIGPQQTPTRDIEFAVRQLVEVAVRALSPGINDPYTAVGCIDYLGAALSELAGRKLPPEVLYDDAGAPRLIRYPFRFADVSDTAIRQIRQYGATSAAVLVRLQEMIADVLPHVRRCDDRDALLRQALFSKSAAELLPQPADRQDVEDRYDHLLEVSSSV